LNLNTNLATITHNAKSHNEECKKSMLLESEKSKIVEKKREENQKLVKLKNELKQLKKIKTIKKGARSKKTKTKRKIIVKLKSPKLLIENTSSKYGLRKRSQNEKSFQEDQDERDLHEINKSLSLLDNSSTSQKDLEKEDEIKAKKIDKELNTTNETSEGVINECDLELLAEEFGNVLDKSNTSSKQAENDSSKKNTSSIVITPIETTDVNKNSEESKKKRKRKRKSSTNENDKSSSILNKSMPQKPKTTLSDKYSANIIAENVDCSSIATESEYSEFFKRKLTEYVSSNWTSNGNARFISVENKIIYYFACVKNKTKAISCPIKCIIELDLNTKLARFMHNGSQHNHDENQCSIRMTLNDYQKKIVARDIDCQRCITPKDYDLFFKQTLSQLLSNNWLKQNETKLNEKDNKSTHYYVCKKNKNRNLKCPSKCFLELDLNTNKAIVMHNGKEHNHPVEPFKPKTQQPQFSCYVSLFIFRLFVNLIHEILW
jgi:hypothetical protein